MVSVSLARGLFSSIMQKCFTVELGPDPLLQCVYKIVNSMVNCCTIFFFHCQTSSLMGKPLKNKPSKIHLILQMRDTRILAFNNNSNCNNGQLFASLLDLFFCFFSCVNIIQNLYIFTRNAVFAKQKKTESAENDFYFSTYASCIKNIYF